MQTHLPSRLPGPIMRRREWWQPVADDSVPDLTDPDIRADLVYRVRAEIASGTYDTPEKMELALRRLLEEFGE